jgi:hypothetical protein
MFDIIVSVVTQLLRHIKKNDILPQKEQVLNLPWVSNNCYFTERET